MIPRITILSDTTHNTLTLARHTEFPTAKEWETLFGHFPYFTAIPDMTQFIDNNKRKSLRSKIPKRDGKQLE